MCLGWQTTSGLNHEKGGKDMTNIDRREFLKSVSVVLGTAAVSGLSSTTSMAQERPEAANASSTGTIYEVFALKYFAPMSYKLAKALYQVGWTEDVKVNLYIWAIRNKNNGEITLVDTGTDILMGQRFSSLNAGSVFVPPPQLVARMGIKPEQVTKVVITHMHIDHVGGMVDFPKLYPNAQFFIQKREFDFWINSPLAQRPAFKMFGYAPGANAIAELAKTPRLTLVDGDRSIDPDMELLLAPGHTPGLQAVLLPTAKGRTILGSDSAHLFRSFKEDLPSGIISDIPAWLLTFDKLRARAPLENIFPGHDPLMSTDFPTVAEDITQLA
jgi:glyoxylase-like metal-dependent hydrolase (beta-lactamase superfamily II)